MADRVIFAATLAADAAAVNDATVLLEPVSRPKPYPLRTVDGADGDPSRFASHDGKDVPELGPTPSLAVTRRETQRGGPAW